MDILAPLDRLFGLKPRHIVNRNQLGDDGSDGGKNSILGAIEKAEIFPSSSVWGKIGAEIHRLSEIAIKNKDGLGALAIGVLGNNFQLVSYYEYSHSGAKEVKDAEVMSSIIISLNRVAEKCDVSVLKQALESDFTKRPTPGLLSYEENLRYIVKTGAGLAPEHSKKSQDNLRDFTSIIDKIRLRDHDCLNIIDAYRNKRDSQTDKK